MSKSQRRQEFEALAKRMAGGAQEDHGEDFDELEDGTGADPSLRTKFVAQALENEEEIAKKGKKRRLQMRADVDLPAKYQGQVVTRRDAGMGEDSEESDQSEGELLHEGADDDDDEQLDLDEEEDEEVGMSSGSDEETEMHLSQQPRIDEDLSNKFKVLDQRDRLALADPARASSSKDRLLLSQEVKTQVNLLQKLAETRIALETPLKLTAKLSSPEALASASSSESTTRAVTEIRSTLATLLALQSELCGKLPGLDLPARKKRKVDAPPLTQEKVWDKQMASHTEPLKNWAINLADEWKTQTSVEVKRPQFKVLDQSIAAQMTFVERDFANGKCTNKIHPVDASQPSNDHSEPTKKPKHELVDHGDKKGERVKQTFDQNTYDDREFYLQMLREIVATGRGTGASAELTHAALEQRDRKKAAQRQRNVDRRASKGRKIRYVPIPKLANFSAPRPLPAVGLAEFGEDSEEVSALMNSLFRY